MAYRKDLERNASALMRVKNPITPLPGDFQNLGEAKKISERKFKRKLRKAKEGEVFKVDNDPGYDQNLVKQTYIKKGKKTFIKRESPSSEWNTTSYYKVKK
tara:strand:- start:1299 stop:1601 length:303 start_codon:yes stop_codon:yes gene_type:complete